MKSYPHRRKLVRVFSLCHRELMSNPPITMIVGELDQGWTVGCIRKSSGEIKAPACHCSDDRDELWRRREPGRCAGHSLRITDTLARLPRSIRGRISGRLCLRNRGRAARLRCAGRPDHQSRPGQTRRDLLRPIESERYLRTQGARQDKARSRSLAGSISFLMHSKPASISSAGIPAESVRVPLSSASPHHRRRVSFSRKALISLLPPPRNQATPSLGRNLVSAAPSAIPNC
jgi:hypothetical protein